jgi:hypothetical protein
MPAGAAFVWVSNTNPMAANVGNARSVRPTWEPSVRLARVMPDAPESMESDFLNSLNRKRSASEDFKGSRIGS